MPKPILEITRKYQKHAEMIKVVKKEINENQKSIVRLETELNDLNK